ncbi:MAG: GNAT family N-acetyltransferase [Pseudomonadota bacterium]
MTDFTLTSAGPDDAAVLADLHIAGWHGAYGGIVDADYLASLTAAQRTADWQKWLAGDTTLQAVLAHDARGIPAGFCAYGKLRTPIPGQSKIRPQYTAEIMALYLHPDFYRQGLGRQLLRHAASDLMAARHQGLALWVLTQNTRACAFYTAMGGQRIGSKDEQMGPRTHREACFGWRDMRQHLT